MEAVSASEVSEWIITVCFKNVKNVYNCNMADDRLCLQNAEL